MWFFIHHPNSFLDVEQCRIPETWENGLAPSLEVPWLTGLEMGLGLILMILEYAHDIVHTPSTV